MFIPDYSALECRGFFVTLQGSFYTMAWRGRKPKEETRRKMSESHFKYTIPEHLALLDMLKKSVKEKGIYYIGSMLLDSDLSPVVWKTWRGRDKSIDDKMEEIESIIETNLVQAVAEGRLKETFGIFTLKSKHKWIDRQQIDHDVRGSLEINIKGLG